jgi:hypothetical protein
LAEPLQLFRAPWLTADYAAKRRILEIILSNYTFVDATLCPTIRKPFDILPKGSFLKKVEAAGIEPLWVMDLLPHRQPSSLPCMGYPIAERAIKNCVTRQLLKNRVAGRRAILIVTYTGWLGVLPRYLIFVPLAAWTATFLGLLRQLQLLTGL